MSDPEESRAMRELKVDLDELELAFDNASWEQACFLDLETGEGAIVSGEINRDLVSAAQELGDGEISAQVLAEAGQPRVCPLPAPFVQETDRKA